MTLLVLLHTTLTLAWLGSHVLLLSKTGPILRKPPVHRAFGRATGIALSGGFGLAVATVSGPPAHGRRPATPH